MKAPFPCPAKKHYYGRYYALKTDGTARFALLAAKDRKGSLEEIPESAYPKLAEMPPVPGGQSFERMDLPPDDLPGADLPPDEGLK